MSKLFRLFAASSLLAASGCSALDVLTFDAAKNTGIVKNQTFVVSYVRPLRKNEEGPDLEERPEARDLFAAKIPEGVLNRCGIEPPMQMFAAGAVALPFVMAIGQMAFDAIGGAIDSRREKLKKAAEGKYDAVAITETMLLRKEPFRKTGTTECVVSRRFAGNDKKNPAMVMVHAVKRFAPKDLSGNGPANATGLTFTPAYLRVDRAAAQTEKVSKGRPKINVTGSLSVAAIQPDAKTGGKRVELVATSPFSFSGVELGVAYINPAFVEDRFDFTPDGTKKLEVPHGPLFVPLRDVPAVGTVSVAIVERGSAAGLDDASAVEKAMRASIRSAIGKSMEAAFKEKE